MNDSEARLEVPHLKFQKIISCLQSENLKIVREKDLSLISGQPTRRLAVKKIPKMAKNLLPLLRGGLKKRWRSATEEVQEKMPCTPS